MPRHDPIPPDYERAARAWARYKRMMRWMAAAAVVSGLLAMVYLEASGGAIPIHMLIATALGVALTVLLGTGLMGLVFLSDRGGHDDAAAGRGEDGR